MLAAAALLLIAGQAHAAQRTPFDHLTTGFELLGQHRDLPCESCHVNAIFKGTPHDCASCHGVGTQVRATAKPASHILTTNACEACHTPVAWSPAVNFDHNEVQGSCSSCHNNVQAQGMGPNHIQTDLDCNVCHTTIGWAGAVFSHQDTVTGCVACHNGLGATGPPADHVPIGALSRGNSVAQCESCHTPTNYTAWKMTNMTATTPPGMVHSDVTAACSTCHEAGLSWAGLPATVLRPPYMVPGNSSSGPHPTTGECSGCHLNTNSFLGATGLPAGHIPLPAADGINCGLCHATSDYTVAVMNHVNIASNCVQCHGAGLTFTGIWTTPLKAPPANHVPVGSATCEGCHDPAGFTTFKIPNTSSSAPPGMVHTAVPTALCATCHAAGVGSTFIMPVKEIPPISSAGGHVEVGTGDCRDCHSNQSFATFSMTNATATAAPGMVHTTVSSVVCSTCHEAGLSFLGAPPTVLRPQYLVPSNPASGLHVTTGECSNCHTNTVSFLNASNLPNGHIPLPGADNNNCALCHATTDYTQATMNHANIAGNCAQCHAAGLSFLGVWTTPLKAPPGNHVQFGAAGCEACHAKSVFTSFQMTNATATAPPGMVHAAVSSIVCSTCHETGLSFAGAPPTVLRPQYLVPGNSSSGLHPGNGECSTCHLNTTSFLGASLYPTNHIPNPGGSTASCTLCHSTSDYSQATMNHQGITSNCAQCHASGLSFAGVWTATPLKAPPTNHIPTGATPCESCHSASAFTNFKISNAEAGSPPGMVHAALGSVNCASCHAAGVGSSFVMPVKEIPSIGSPGGHVQIAGADCKSCHTPTAYTSFVITNKTNTAPPGMVHSLVSSVVCSTCHESGLTFLGAPATVVRPQYLVPGNSGSGLHPINGECSTCHLNTTSFLGASLYPTDHIPNPGGSGATCGNCHTTADYSQYVMSHAGINNNCAQCHAAGLSFAGVWTTTPLKAPPTNHIPFGTTTCESCHAANVFTNFKINNADSGAPPGMVHSALGAVSCLTCHAAGVGSKFVMPVKEIPTIGSPGGHVQTGGADCGSCHTPTAYTSFVMTNKTNTAPPGMVHGLVSSVVCSTCHETGLSFVGAPATVLRPQYLVIGNPGSGLHPTTGECSNCHLNTNSFLGATLYPNNHIPNPGGSGANCSTCHTTGDYAAFVMSHAGINNNCAQCHAAGLSFAGVWTTTPLKAPPTNHIPFGSVTCESCHAVNVFTNFKINNADSGAPPGMVHTALGAVSCLTCHGAGVGSKFVMPVKEIPSIGSPGGHVQTGGADCGSCHVPTTFTSFVFANKTGTAPPSMVHSLVSSVVCSTCHEAGLTFVGAPATVVRPQYLVPGNSGSGLHPTTGECSNCHLNTNSFLGAISYPSGHIPNPGGSAGTCTNCHTNASDYSVYTMNHTGITNKCAQCHAAGLSFAGVWTALPLKAPPSNHIPFGTVACESCHSASTFTNFKINNADSGAAPGMVHSALGTVSCSTCHAAGVGSKFVMPVKEIPTIGSPGGHVQINGADCKSCHAPAGYTTFVFTNATGTAPPAMVHSLVTSIVCSTCHEAGLTFVGAPATVVRPQYKVPGNSSSGLHATTGECSNCHLNTTSFLGATDYPTGHIPNPGGSSGTCANCHTTGNYSVYVMSHTGITNACAACHAAGLTFAGVWTTTPLKAPPTNHVPFKNSAGTAADCSVCHSNSAFTTFAFTNASGTAPSAMVHSAVSGVACATCHATGLSFVGTPATKAPPSNHVPFGTAACEGCHSGTTFTSFAFTNKTGTAPPAMVHSLVSSTVCSTCHEAGKTFVGTPATVVRPQYLVPGNSSSGAHPTTGECSQCHLNTTSFLGAVSYPTGHIPNPGGSSATCSNCHTTGDYSVYVMSHTGITSNCAQCHAYGLSFYGVWTAKPLVAPPAGTTGHIPSNPPNGTLNVTCESCHSATVFTSFTGTIMKHSFVSSMTCMSCHEYGAAWKIDSANKGYNAKGGKIWQRDGANHHAGQDCKGSGCHNTKDVRALRRAAKAGVVAVARGNGAASAAGGPAALGGTLSLNGAVGVGPAGFDHRRAAGSCVSCHSLASGAGKPADHITTTDSCQSCHSTVAWLPVTAVDHMQVLGTCVSCHNGRIATGVGSTHIASSTACATCHTTNAWTPARFDHVGVAAHTCRSCHDAIHATGLPANHVVTGAQCDTCHGTLAWTPATLDHTTLTGHCVGCHNNRIALGVSPTHMTTAIDCAVCHSYPDWSVLRFVHSAATYPGDHKVTLSCASCHTSNTDQIPWPAPPEAGSCAGCHAKDFTAGHHPKTSGGAQYTVSELRNCAGACHVYSDATQGTIVKTIPGPYHRVLDVAFKH